ncbi:serine hydrolase [Lysinibacillus sp. FJAT-14745]|uniref:serine hydrolase n=1 Tax=Lysinibacillus sp. FJAT-14745 TaxID=1704289 RepID=UPI0006ABB325|nr:serine hydrolase [Lysinibacillus sp. FJAT-14745]
MTIWAWIGLLGIVMFSLLSLLKKENRTKEEIRKTIVTGLIVLGIIVAVLFFNANYILALIAGFIAMIVFDKKTYTKKRIIIYGSFILVVGIASYFFFRDNPDYVLNHLKDYPQTTSLYIAENGEELITYQSDMVRPLASTVKMLIAVEYAMQINEGIITKDSPVPLDDLKRYYIKNTDGNAHENWLKTMRSEGKVKNNEVTLHDVAKGMITYSSNANTDFLIDLLGITNINERAQSLKLTQHEEVYPIVSALLIPEQIENETLSEKQLIKKLREMPIATYRSKAEELSEQMKIGTIKAEDISFDMSMDLQKVWSDRLIGASANDYGKLLAIISNDKLPEGAANTIRDLLEWPMQYNEQNHERFVHLGAKGGSTAFVLNDAIYTEDHNGNKIEMVILTDDLNFWQGLLIRKNMNSFESKLLGSKDYRLKIQKKLSES